MADEQIGPPEVTYDPNDFKYETKFTDEGEYEGSLFEDLRSKRTEIEEGAKAGIAGLGMAAVFGGPLGILVAGGMYAFQKMQRNRMIEREASRLQDVGRKMNISGDDMALIHGDLEDRNFSGLTGDALNNAQAQLRIDTAEFARLESRRREARLDLISGDPQRVALGEARYEAFQNGMDNFWQENEDLAQKFEERDFNDRKIYKEKLQGITESYHRSFNDEKNEYDSAMSTFHNAISLDAEPDDLLIAKNALFRYIETPIQNVTIPGMVK